MVFQHSKTQNRHFHSKKKQWWHRDGSLDQSKAMWDKHQVSWLHVWTKARPKRCGTNTKSHGSMCGVWGFSFRGLGDFASPAWLSVIGLFLGLFALCGFWQMSTKPSSSVWYCPKSCHALKVLCALLFTPPCHWPPNCSQNFTLSTTSYHWNHTVCSFLSLISFMQ